MEPTKHGCNKCSYEAPSGHEATGDARGAWGGRTCPRWHRGRDNLGHGQHAFPKPKPTLVAQPWGTWLPPSSVAVLPEIRPVAHRDAAPGAFFPWAASQRKDLINLYIHSCFPPEIPGRGAAVTILQTMDGADEVLGEPPREERSTRLWVFDVATRSNDTMRQ